MYPYGGVPPYGVGAPPFMGMPMHPGYGNHLHHHHVHHHQYAMLQPGMPPMHAAPPPPPPYGAGVGVAPPPPPPPPPPVAALHPKGYEYSVSGVRQNTGPKFMAPASAKDALDVTIVGDVALRVNLLKLLIDEAKQPSVAAAGSSPATLSSSSSVFLQALDVVPELKTNTWTTEEFHSVQRAAEAAGADVGTSSQSSYHRWSGTLLPPNVWAAPPRPQEPLITAGSSKPITIQALSLCPFGLQADDVTYTQHAHHQ